MLGLPDRIRACLFDLDGVLTDTASVHRRAWKAMFDEFLREHTGPDFTPFDAGADYEHYVDGKPRLDGIRSFLASRDISVDEKTVVTLGDRKNELFGQVLRDHGVTVFDGSRRYLQAALESGLRRAVVSSSANTEAVLALTGLDTYIEHRVDGVTLREENIAGKPAPDSFLRAAELLGVTPEESAVFEDAIAGVAAGRAGGFGIVVGVDRGGQAQALRENGADIIVTDLGELLTP
ncbi:beta-phosphoglucomutase family hydrolase [Mycobacterium sp. pV006]|uniref:beta-phosphoglucomutase family hydrolase n=1 Tax=Mycobacterium sp. pV006 TaxID=3238983 RepID=UPI00351BC061